MLIEDVKKLSPLDRLIYWVVERESIRLKKEAGDPWPFTDDEILKRYRFCCVRRMDDRVSRWLLDNWYVPYKDHPNILAAVSLARFVNKPSSLGLITECVFSKAVAWGEIKNRLRKAKESGPIFNGAYVVRGNDGIDKVESVVDHNVRLLVQQTKPRLDTTSMQKTWKEIVPAYGFGSFMAGQVVADLRWAVSGTWKDRHTWAPLGPGSKQGLNLLYQFEPKASQTEEEFYGMLEDTAETLKKSLPKEITSRLEAHDYQNCCCEYSKYIKALLGIGKPKQLYRGLPDGE